MTTLACVRRGVFLNATTDGLSGLARGIMTVQIAAVLLELATQRR